MTYIDPIEGERFDGPRIGGTIEDETGWWQIVEIAADEGGVWLMDKHGNERFRMFERLGSVTYDVEPRSDIAEMGRSDVDYPEMGRGPQ